MLKTTCGIYLYDLTKHCLLIGHVTNSNKRFSIPKGEFEENEDEGYYECAEREFEEETNLKISELNVVMKKELPFVKYRKHDKQLKSYLIVTESSYDNKEIKCVTFFVNEKTGEEQPEIDAFLWVDLSSAKRLLPLSQKYNIKEIRKVIENIEQFQ